MKFFDHLDMTVRIVAGLCLFAVFVLVTAQVASRFLFNFSLAAASELSIYAMIWSVFLGSAVAFRSNSHIAMDILKNKLPKPVEGVADVLIFILLAGFLCLIATEGYDLALRAMRQSSPAAKIPVGYITMAIPVGSILALIFLTEQKLRPFFKDKRHD
ncbi:TRAP transporter small permease [Pacificibacter marinus]|uniref:TRAP transporter small permease n=1 Tax=Pacificibacter marinus TaxID=658057 RepID=UPI001C066B3A|nr:TRAP transporter small permease [Pacificibacter marinus]MBU2865829.1 TRAP transporter small permease [Pacificibacter marinus]